MERIEFNSGDLTLEGLFTEGSSDRGVVVTHPHPLYGGDMNNPVVQTVADAYIQAGYSCLQFNFRGVGRSTGQFDNGRGERADVLAALDCLTARGAATLSLAGYSFGSWVNAYITAEMASLAHQIMVSPPVAFIEFAEVVDIPMLTFVVTGGRDEIAPPGGRDEIAPPGGRDEIAPPGIVAPLITGWNPEARMEIIPEADHFYSGCLDRLGDLISNQL